MKNTFKYIAFGIAMLASSFSLNAQYNREGGMATSKKVTGPTDGYYTIELESFATGETTVTESTVPVDIVLVLDVSGSMDETLITYSYTARTSQGYSYDSYGNATYYYKHTDDQYYPVSRSYEYDGTGNYNSWSNFYTRLSYSVNGNTYYLSGQTTTTTPPTNVKGNTTTIWTGILYTRNTSSTQSKMAALKAAVGSFIDEVTKNATEDSQGRPRSVDNQISIVKFAGIGNQNPAYYDGEDQYQPTDGGNHRNNNNYNYTEVVTGLTSVLDGGGASLKTTVNSLNAGGATAANGGMKLALNIISRIPSDRESNKVVVLFTDGTPTYGNTFSNTVANGAIDNAYTLKNSHDVTVFTIGVFDDETTNIRTYMNYVSSNYPNARNMTTAGSGGSDQGYYQNATGVDLTKIFKDIASASAAADATAGASTQVRDVVSNSFIMPEGDAAQITIKVADITSDGSDWETPVVAEGVSYEVTTVTASTGEQHKQLMVTGFDYTKADTYDPDGFTVTPGNWVGERYSDAHTTYWAGKKLIISFKIQADDEATGGDGSATNHPDSGVYVQQFNDDGTPKTNPDGSYVYSKVNQYEVPHTDLPLLIKISKDGLRTGESATFQIMRIRPKVDSNGDYVINAIGKPEPNTHEFNDPTGKLDPNDPMDYLEGTGWEDWSKVILTNKGADKAVVTKTLYGLDPGWVYIVVEDDWGWSYTLTGSASSMTTANTEINPFNFHNEPRTVNLEGNPIVKHAEAVTINHFETLEGEGAREEHYKSSKTDFKSKK